MEKYCKYCGSKLNENDRFCTNCGKNIEENTTSISNTNSYSQSNYNIYSKTSPIAIASFICSLAGLFIWGITLGVIAICLGVLSINHMKVFKNERGRGLSIAGIIIGILDILWALIFTLSLFNM